MSSSARPVKSVLPDSRHFEEEIWEALDPFLFPPKAFKNACKEIAAIVKKTGLKEGRVLDLACGPGRHSIPLAKNGLHVTGVDRSSFLLGKARDYAFCEGVGVEFIQEDMRYFSRQDSYDLALSLYSSFGYFDDPADNQKVLNCTYDNLKKGGAFFIDLPGREVLARNFKNSVRKRVQKLGQITEYRTIYSEWKRLGLNWRFYQDEQLRDYSFSLWLYSGDEIKEMLTKAGFAAVTLYGDFALKAYDERAKQLIAFAVK
ncbi:MAG: methyltransferase domain-containing protein [Syntrophaceae bacterium]